MSRFRDEHDDPAGCRDGLHAVLTLPELAEFDQPGPISARGRHAAYELAAALGRCRLFGVAPGDDLDGTLTTPLALAAARVLRDLLESGITDARELGERWDAAAEAHAAEDLCLNLLESRMECWAAYLAIDEAYAECMEAQDTDLGGFTGILDSLLAAIETFDQELQRQSGLLSVAAETELLQNWRNLLAAPYREPLPWWLDGSLEEAARRVQQEALTSQPDEIARRRRDGSGEGLEEDAR